jgi:hypothetical protein
MVVQREGHLSPEFSYQVKKAWGLLLHPKEARQIYFLSFICLCTFYDPRCLSVLVFRPSLPSFCLCPGVTARKAY